MVVAAFVAPFLLAATVAVRRHRGPAARRPAGRGHHRARGAGAAGAGPAPRRALAGGRRARPAADRRAVPGCPGSWAGSSGWSAPSSSCRCRSRRCGEALGIAGHGRRDRAQRAGQGPDEGRCCTRPACRAPATSSSPPRPRRWRSPRRSGSRSSPSRRRAPGRRRPTGSTTPTRCAAGSPPSRRGPDAPGLLEEFLVGEEHTFDSVTVGGHDRVGVDRRTTCRRRWRCCATRGSSGRCCCPASSTTRATPASSRSGRPPSRRSGCATGSRTWSGSAAPTARSRSPRSAPGRPARRSPRCSATCTTSTSTGCGRELVILDRFDPPARRYAAGCAYLRGQGRGRVRAVHGVDELQRRDRAPGRRGEAARAGPAGVVELRGRGLRDRPRPGHRGRARRAARGSSTASAWSWWRPQ